jgi:hypothetical protein
LGFTKTLFFPGGTFFCFEGGRFMATGPGLFGSGGYYNPQGPYGPWAGCGCSSFLIILAGILLVMGGCLRMLGQ